MKIVQLLLEYDREKTLKNWKDKLEARSQTDTRASADSILCWFENIDPSPNNQYVQWMVRQYIKGQFKKEDLYKVRNLLVDFLRLKNRLPVAQRDINKHDFYGLSQIIDDILNIDLELEKSKKSQEEVKQEIEKFGDDVEVLYYGPLGSLTVPLTMEASCRLGKGTKWCTSAEDLEHNAFDMYNVCGYLYTWKDKNGDKYQFHIWTEQYMDSRDRPISKDKVEEFKRHPVLKNIFDPTSTLYQKDMDRVMNTFIADADKANERISTAIDIVTDELPPNTIPSIFDKEVRYMIALLSDDEQSDYDGYIDLTILYDPKGKLGQQRIDKMLLAIKPEYRQYFK